MTGLQRTDDARGSARKLTYADFLKFPDDGRRHELIDGEHYVTGSPNRRHQELSLRLTLALGNYLEANPIGQLLYAPFDCVLSMFDVVVPDLLVVMGDQKVLTKKNCHGVPALVVEILSPATAARDRTKKRSLYERCGAREYWVVDPSGDAITVHRRSGDRFGKPIVLRASDAQALDTPLLPGFALPLTPYFRD